MQSAETVFTQQDLTVNPSTLDEEGRKHHGVIQKLPRSLQEALDALERDVPLNEAMAHGLVQDYVTMKESEIKMLGGMGESERRVFVIERY